MTTDISLPRHVTPRWPERCVGCEGRPPDRVLRRRTRTLGWGTVGALLPFLGWLGRGERFEAEAPVCGPCRAEARRDRLVEWGLLLLLLVPVVVFVYGPLRGDGPTADTALKIGTMALVLVPFAIWRVRHPPSFEVTAFAEHVEYEFRDPAYAADFAALNGAARTSDPGGDGSSGS